MLSAYLLANCATQDCALAQQARINLNYRPLSRLSMHLKVMPKSGKGHKFILCIIDEVTNYLIMAPIYQSKVEEIGEALIEHKFILCIIDEVTNYLIMAPIYQSKVEETYK